MDSIKLRDLGKLGIITDIRPSEIPDGAWSSGNNVSFRDGILQRIAGEIDIFDDPDLIPENVQFYPDPQSGKAYWIYAGPDKTSGDFGIGNWDGSQHNLLTASDIGSAYTNGNGWTSGAIAGVPYFNNGSGAPWVWLRTGADLKTSVEQVSTWVSGMKAMYVRSFLNFWILMDITEGSNARNPSRLIWSHPAAPYSVPASFDITDPAYLTGDKTLGDTSDYIVDCMALRGINVVYKRNETWAMRPSSSASQVFTFDRIFPNVGLLGPRLVCSFQGDKHFCVTNDRDIIIHNGNTRESIADNKNRKIIFDNIDEDNFIRSFVKLHQQKNEIWFCYPTSGNTYCNKAAIWDYKRNNWTFRDLQNATDMAFGIPDVDPTVYDDAWDTGPNITWEADNKSWDEFISSLLLAQSLLSTSERFVAPDKGTTFSGTDFNAYVERIGITFDEPRRRKEVISLFPEINGDPVTISIGASDYVDGPYSWQARQFDPRSDHKISFRKNGRYLGLRISGSGQWRVGDMDLNMILRGYR